MREIAFRAKREDTGEWVYGYPLIDTAPCTLKAVGKCVCPHDGSVAGMYVWEDDFHEYNYFDVKADTIGQYTGFVDKIGTRIFEGDIVRVCGKRGKSGLVAFQYGRWEVGYGILFHIPAGEMEVIGNVHDNPELLT